MAGGGFRKRRSHEDNFRHRWQTVATLADGTQGCCRFNSRDSSVETKKQEFQATGTLDGTGGGGRRAAGRQEWHAARTSVWVERECSQVNRDAKQTKMMEKN
jgi:hypothetical protein